MPKPRATMFPTTSPGPDAAPPGELDLYLDWWTLTLQGRAPGTIRRFTTHVRQFIVWLTRLDPPVATAAGVTRHHLIAFRNQSLAHNAQSTSYYRDRDVRLFFTYLVDESILTEYPFPKVKPLARPKAPPIQVIEPSAFTALLTTIRLTTTPIAVRNEALVRFLADTGCRVAEMTGATGLLISNLDLTECTAEVFGKGSKWRTVAYTQTTAVALNRWLGIRARSFPVAAHRYPDHVFISQRHHFTPEGVRTMLNDQTAKAGVPHIHPHQFRHTFAHEFLSAGGQEGDLMELGGWESRQMLDRYGKSGRKTRALASYRKIKG